MHPIFAKIPADSAIPIWFVTRSRWTQVRQQLDKVAIAFVESSGFTPKPGRHFALPSAMGGLAGILFGLEEDDAARDPFLPGSLPELLPPGTYRFANSPHDTRLACLAFALGSYRFARYRKVEAKPVTLVLPDGVNGEELSRIVEGATLARDLVNTPSNDMGPAELEEAVRHLAKKHGAKVNVVIGDDLLKQNFPLIHAVGRASSRAPRLIDLRWGNASHPKVTLVGKGVCFDTGGLDLKPESAMTLMKKDMGGAASLIGLSHMIMAHGLKISLRLLIPAVENSISANAYRPLDIYSSRKGLTVEIGDTDAEGRLVLADALTLADEDTPDLLIDAGTLTGAARVALGPDLPPFYTGDDNFAREIEKFTKAESDPVWRMPLWLPYDAQLESKIADLSNVTANRFAGSITCALFLQRFVTAAKAWAHFDIYAWNPGTKPGRPEGGECQAARGLYALLSARYG